jgi:hypothetical protein
MYTVHFVGLNYFSARMEGEEVALIPNGTPDSSKKDEMVPQHFASVFIEEEDYATDDWWEDHKIPREIKLEVKLGEFRTVKVIEFRIPDKKDSPAKVMFSCDEKKLVRKSFEEGIPKLKDVKGFVLDPEPDTIANVPLPGGTLEVFRFSAAAIVRWLITEHDDPITIRASANGETKYITLNKSDEQLPTEIVFSNTVDLLTTLSLPGGNGHNGGNDGVMSGMPDMGATHATHAMPGMPAMPAGHMHGHGTAGHFVLYAKLDKERDEDKFENPKLPDYMRLRMTQLPFHHAYLSFLSSLEETPDKPCVPTCCGGH